MDKKRAVQDDRLSVRIVESTPLYYIEGADPDREKPNHVRAGSSLAYFEGCFVAVQDDADYLAVIDLAQRNARGFRLPDGPDDHHIYDDRDHTGDPDVKLDLESCVALPEQNGHRLLALSSGVSTDQQWAVLAHWKDEKLEINMWELPAFFNRLRGEKAFAGSGLNLEGLVLLGGDRLMLFQRGNADVEGNVQATDATAELSLAALRTYLSDPEGAPPPAITNVTQYDLGELDGVRLTFSDGDCHEGRLLFTASAEGDDRITGAVIGVIDADGQARWTTITDENGEMYRGKVEGIATLPADRQHVYFIIDADDKDKPSCLFKAVLSGPWFEE